MTTIVDLMPVFQLHGNSASVCDSGGLFGVHNYILSVVNNYNYSHSTPVHHSTTCYKLNF